MVTRAELEQLRDSLYVLETAVDDVERDLREMDGEDAAELRHAVDWLLKAARPLLSLHP